MRRSYFFVGAVAALAILAGCGDGDDSAQAKSVPQTATTSATAGTTSASETPVLPSEETASTNIETGAPGYANLGERQARFDKFYPTFSSGVARFIYSQHLGEASYFVAHETVPTCSSTDREDKDSKYDNVSEQLVLVCTYDKRHGVVQQFADTGRPDEALLPASIMLDGIVIAPMLDDYAVYYENNVLPENPTLAELKRHDDEAIRLLKDAVHRYFGEDYIAKLGLA